MNFNFLGQAGSDLDGNSVSATSLTVDGITLTLNAGVVVDGSAGVFNQTADNFGINANETGDETDAIDGALGFESIVFSVTSSVALSSLTLDAFNFDRITPDTTSDGVDAGSLVFTGGSTLNFSSGTVSGSDVLTVGESITTGQQFTLSHVAGNGFGLEDVTFTAVAVPEPSSIVFLGLAGSYFVVRRRRRSNR